MKRDAAQTLRDLFYEAETEFPDKSTAFLMEIVCGRARHYHLGFQPDHGDVAEALSKTPKTKI
jgi:hypothetical protein